MKTPYNWLESYCRSGLSAADLADRLTMTGTKVEALHSLGVGDVSEFVVGRVVSAERGLRFGVYVKPHRGAPIQRTLSAVSRNARMLYWYTYGPDWAKGDTFAASPEALAATSKAARLIANSEDVLYGSSWSSPAQVAVVSPRSSEIWMRLAGGTPDLRWVTDGLPVLHLSSIVSCLRMSFFFNSNFYTQEEWSLLVA